jgi:hypothetical protein
MGDPLTSLSSTCHSTCNLPSSSTRAAHPVDAREVDDIAVDRRAAVRLAEVQHRYLTAYAAERALPQDVHRSGLTAEHRPLGTDQRNPL